MLKLLLLLRLIILFPLPQGAGWRLGLWRWLAQQVEADGAGSVGWSGAVF
jgi:hypothetical protein